MSRVEELIEKMRELGNEPEFFGPQSRESISTLETALGVTLPPSYVEFLETYGGGGVGDSSISGIFGGQPLMTNNGCTYGDTVRWRDEYGLPDHLVVIMDQDGEEAVCLDTQRTDGGEAAVVRVDLFGGGTPKARTPRKEAASFAEFFENYLEMWAIED